MSKWSTNEEAVIKVGGLFVLGTERNGLRRVDNQLAGRAGRQGNPGTVLFLLSLEDELLKVFGRSRGLSMLQKAVSNAGMAISGKHAARLVTQAQQKYEGQGFDARKQLMKFDSVLAEQRKVLYDLRASLFTDQGAQFVEGSISSAVQKVAEASLSDFYLDETKAAAVLKSAILTEFGVNLPVISWVSKNDFEEPLELVELVVSEIQKQHKSNTESKLPEFGLILGIIDDLWAEHLTSLDELRQAANLKGHAGQNPLYQFTKEGYTQFEGYLNEVCQEVAKRALNAGYLSRAEREKQAHDEKMAGFQAVADTFKSRCILRSEQCPCGSGKLYKACHGKLN